MSHGPTDSAHAGRPAPLRREVIVRRNDQGRAALLSGLLALAGVELGLVVALTGLARHASYADYPGPAYLDRSAALVVGPASGETSWLGVEVRMVPWAELKARGLTPGGALVSDVFTETPAERAGIARGDVIHKVDGVTIDGPAGLVHAIRSHRPGAEVTVELSRGDELRTVTTNLASISTPQLRSLEGASRR